MKILAIESSCDETGAAVVEDGSKIISNALATSAEMHEKTGGIIPEQAARQQVSSIIPIISRALNGMDLKRDIDALAVTIGPGLIGSLLVGVETAKTLSMLCGLPLIPVNHVLAHLYANFLENPAPVGSGDSPPSGTVPISFPAIGLVVSGGHTELFYMEEPSKLKWIGGTLDDAAGEAFDKTARLLGLGFPGGPAIAESAAKFKTQNSKFKTNNIRLPRPMMHDNSFNFSFSGLKTAVLREVQKKSNSPELITNLAYEIEESISDVLVKKTLAAAEKYRVKSILLGGGVAANKTLSQKFKTQNSNTDLKLHVPPPKFCTDNAAYIGAYAYFYNSPADWREIEARPDLEVEV